MLGKRKHLALQFRRAPAVDTRYLEMEQLGERLDKVRRLQPGLTSDWSKNFWHQVECQLVRRMHMTQIER